MKDIIAWTVMRNLYAFGGFVVVGRVIGSVVAWWTGEAVVGFR